MSINICNDKLEFRTEVIGCPSSPYSAAPFQKTASNHFNAVAVAWLGVKCKPKREE